MQDPEGAAAELERCVVGLGFKGALISGTINDRFLDDPIFAPVLAQAERLNVPLYLHPAPPPEAVYKAYFERPARGDRRQPGHLGLGMACRDGAPQSAAGRSRRIRPLSQPADHHRPHGRKPPFSLARADERLAPFTTHLQRRIKDYFLMNFHITTSAYFTLPPLLCALMVFGVDRILFSVDYPFASNARARTLLETAPLSTADLEKIAHLNAERLLKL